MLLFKDIITDDELISGAYKLNEVDGIVYEADCRMIQISEDFDIGANPSAEEHEEVIEDRETVIDIIYSFNLSPTSFDKKAYLRYLKGYVKAVKENLKAQGTSDEELRDYEHRANVFAKKVMGKFDDYQFYAGKSFNPDGMVVLLNYREDGTTPYVTFWKHGLTAIKI
ncbi:Translationally-controlled tumor protein [Penicillium malachiteum]|uniref:Translationally-controlled tumor protein homolog n=1 Tax=Penicillium malachiteum TaxID=1324776 RepID=A0AAD6MZN9_9EURO|nr:Translationally-controlled tumor protein [Penicillium malachiteum]